MTTRRIPQNLFGIALGLAGLAGAWRATEPVLGTPSTSWPPWRGWSW